MVFMNFLGLMVVLGLPRVSGLRNGKVISYNLSEEEESWVECGFDLKLVEEMVWRESSVSNRSARLGYGTRRPKLDRPMIPRPMDI